MCKSKTYVNNVEEPYQKKDWVRYLSLGIIAICVVLLLGLLGLMARRATNNTPQVYRVIVTSDISPDSLKAYNYMSLEQADSLINALKTYDAQLIQKYQYLVEQKEQDSQVFYWGSLIVGIVIAVFGWFGFQSFTTIEDKAKKKASTVAQNVAQRTAWKETKNYLKVEGKKLIEKTTKENRQDAEVKNIKEQVINELNTIIENRMAQYAPSNKINDMDKRIESLENSVIPEIDKAVRDAVNEVFGRYKRPIKGTSNDKEEKK